MRYRWAVWGIALVAGVGVGVGAAIATRGSGGTPLPTVPPLPSAGNPRLDPGTPMSGRAPDFTLTDQFGKRVSLSSFRGKVVVLSFNDPVCTTICPLTTTAMLHAKALLGPAGRDVQLLGVGANPEATQIKYVRAYSTAHHMLHKWLFLNGPIGQLHAVWKKYNIAAAVIRGAIDHTPATFVIDSRGRYSRLYISEMAYSSVNQLGEEMAQSIAALLPGRPHVRYDQSLAPVKLLGPAHPVTLPRVGGGTVKLGPGTGPHLVLFFDTWESEVLDMRAGMESLQRYAASGLPPLVAVDEADVEGSPTALSSFLGSLPRPLSYPVAIDRTGRVADGYRVEDSPWLTLVDGKGHFLFYYDVSVKGWPSPSRLAARVRAALARAPR
ncbi:MAG TPA: redoxin domain-containing protein [Gaiellaceae bacterium]|nr:redoxin domain-containing protein [Gaiellaceae bacterium]